MSTPIHPAIAHIAATALPAARRRGVPAAPTTDVQDALLAEIVDTQGASGLLLAGRGLHSLPNEPLLLALLNSDSPTVLLDKIARLNRYAHANHRHRIHDSGPMHVHLEHVAISGTPPTSDQSLFVCGLYVALLEAIGCEALTVRFPRIGATPLVVYDDGVPIHVPSDDTAHWLIDWKRHVRGRVLPGLDEVLLGSPPPDLEATNRVASATVILSADLSRSWRLDDLARALHISSRTLQRELREEGTSFSRMLTDLRVAEARRLLRATTMSIGDIGYTTGFADTAHFSRTFRDRVGSTPTDWRAVAPGD